MCRDAADTRLLGEVLLGRPFSTRRASGLRLGIVRGSGATSTPTSRPAAATPWSAARRRRPGARGRARGARARRDRDRDPASARGNPRRAARLVAEIADQVSPISRALRKYQLLMPAARCRARGDRARELRRSVARAFERVDALAWPATPAPAPPIEDPRVDLPSGRVPADAANTRLGGIGNLTGVPPLRCPSAYPNGLPAGLQCSPPGTRTSACSTWPSCWSSRPGARYVEAVPPVAERATA